MKSKSIKLVNCLLLVIPFAAGAQGIPVVGGPVNFSEITEKTQAIKAAEFAASYAAKALTVVERVEKTANGQRAFVQVAGKACTVDMVEHRGQFQATAIDCAK